jgi:hypothetical protein
VASARPAPTLRHAEVDGCRVILDLNTEAYRVLDDVASVMWAVAIGEADSDRSLEDLAERYDVDRHRLDSDLVAFHQRCVAEGLLDVADGAPAVIPSDERRARITAPTMLGALRSLYGTQRALRRDGFRATYVRYASLPAGTDSARLHNAARAFVRAENFFVARRAPDDCLVRSLSLYRFLRSAGIPAQHVIGARRFPFQAHAWVECDGEEVLDDRQRRERFTPLARLGAMPANSAGT